MNYIDLDGCLADFRSWVLSKDKKAFNESGDIVCEIMVKYYKECFKDFGIIEKNKFLLDLDGPKKVLTVIPVKSIIKYAVEHDMKLEKAFDIIRKLKRNKIYWCKKYLGISEHDIIFCNTRSEKLIYACGDSILYDDCEETVESWKKHGCKGILIK